MNLEKIIERFRKETLPQMDTNVIDTLTKGIEDLKIRKIENDALKVGDKMPSFILPDANGKEISSDELLDNGTLIISFYRGGWCPYCNLELRALQDLLPEFEKYNANLVAISPEKPDNSLSTQEKNELKFPVLSDINNLVAKSMGLVFEVPKEVVDLSKKEFSLDLTEINETAGHELPIPASYVVDTNGIIQFAFVNPDYTKRAEPIDILNTIKITQNKI